ncbi:MAG TPA: hypothetical protein H9871_04680 [Candidatus Nesterenkonia stercoripullorum]|uniref:DUF485 domain-containing protein n=1 Tax=Candidatus Nesterenkonia stercoripullorum TaxID=2838701 RepID=A0A9D1S0Y6_9MICC|nr:hypothetical protein [Candidatus Nesterenkonia stercoripullorum]
MMRDEPDEPSTEEPSSAAEPSTASEHSTATERSAPDFSALRRRRVPVRRPGVAPSAEEVLLSPSRGHITPSSEATSRVRGLMRAQLRAALIVSIGFFAVMLAVGAGGVLFRDLATATLAGIPWEWLLPGAGFFPLLLVAGWWYVRTAERLERRFTASAEPGEVAGSNDD